MSAGAPKVKTCSKCGRVKPLNDFGKYSRNKVDGRHYRCKPCNRQDCKDYYAANGEKRRQTQQAYRQANSERLASEARAWRTHNPDHEREYRREYRLRNPDVHRQYNGLRRARIRGVDHEPYTRSEIFAAYGGACAYCDAPAEHLDHVVALSRGGADAAHNLLPACAPCNLSKGAKSLADWVLSWP
ncbi:HNH endonuclease [Streptomyces afghaniensis]|uniref:HNH endonuclease n=1 Tax=Streptomyces afghaniensis TaxID=66865 RepID=UPI0037CF00C1